ncbi:NADH-quinone oxidoreductase subunit N, partial [Pseudomonas sp. MPR-R2A5]|uniref:proton-conducting transporter transmembrane domain-containing protein n=1 Tax=Pseudomonas sp. MPR-R2A5 TaxID=2070622 RepID=UPI000CB527D0
APKVAAIGLAVRVAVEAMGLATDQWRQIVIFAALASIIFGAVAAIGQTNVKRLLAYSSINNVGFVLIGLAAGTQEGVAAVLFYLTVYVVMTLGSFIVVLQMKDSEGQPVETIA